VGIKINTDGSVNIDKLNLFGKTIGVSDGIPGDAAKRGDIRLNRQPDVGKPIGWVCVDGIRWSSFGIIE
jgi:hypothetical protein